MLDRQRLAARSVYIRGFPKKSTITTELVTELFKTFGETDSIFISVEHIKISLSNNIICLFQELYAIVTFKHEDSASAAMGNPPVVEGKPLVVKPRAVKKNIKSSPKTPAAAVDKMEETLPPPVSTLPLPKETMDTIKSAKSVSNSNDIYLL